VHGARVLDVHAAFCGRGGVVLTVTFVDVVSMPVRAMSRRGAHRLQEHPALGALARAVLTRFRVHGAAVLGVRFRPCLGYVLINTASDPLSNMLIVSVNDWSHGVLLFPLSVGKLYRQSHGRGHGA